MKILWLIAKLFLENKLNMIMRSYEEHNFWRW